MSTNTLLLGLCLGTMVACQSATETIERRDANGRLERFQQHRKTHLKEGLYEQFREDGTLAEQANYVQDTLHGERILYFPDGKQKESIYTYAMGVYHGPYRLYYPDGQLHLEQQFARGVLEGLSLRYYPTGQLEERVTMHNNEESGPFEEFYPNGHKKAVGNYIFDHDTALEQGELREYDSTGVLIRVADCEAGICRTRK